jgi:hypothetical protein
MKTTYVLAGLLALSMVAFAFVAPVAAQEPIAFGPTIINSTQKGKMKFIWHFDTYDTTNGPFSGLDIIPGSIVATCWDSKGTVYTVTSYDIVFEANYVELYIKNQDLPKNAVGNSVAGSLANGDTFLASGPGWQWFNTH